MTHNALWTRLFLMKIVLGFIILAIFPSASMSEDKNFTKYFMANNADGMFVDIPFSLNGDSIVYTTYNAECSSQENSRMYLYTSWGGQATSADQSTLQPYGPMPLHNGNYVMRIQCLDEEVHWDAIKSAFVGENGNEVKCTSTVSSTPITSSFGQDQEPDMDDSQATQITGIQTFQGWIGLAGYSGLQDSAWSSSGIDSSDIYYFNLKKDETLQFKLDYDESFIDNPFFSLGGDLQIIINKWENGQTYYVDTFDNWFNSGDLSKIITLKEDATYKISVRGGYGSRVPKSNYGGYKMTVYVNTPPPPPVTTGLLLTFLSAKWSNNGEFHWLDIKYKVENKSDVPKRIASLGQLRSAKLDKKNTTIWKPPANSLYLQYTKWIGDGYNACGFAYKDTGCQKDNMLLGKMLQVCDASEQKQTHQYLDITMSNSPYTVLPNTTQEHSFLIIPTKADYESLYEGYQGFNISIEDDNEMKCYSGAVYHFNKEAAAGWLLLLLK